jgi:hypothetical protein
MCVERQIQDGSKVGVAGSLPWWDGERGVWVLVTRPTGAEYCTCCWQWKVELLPLHTCWMVLNWKCSAADSSSLYYCQLHTCWMVQSWKCSAADSSSLYYCQLHTFWLVQSWKCSATDSNSLYYCHCTHVDWCRTGSVVQRTVAVCITASCTHVEWCRTARVAQIKLWNFRLWKMLKSKNTHKVFKHPPDFSLREWKHN